MTYEEFRSRIVEIAGEGHSIFIYDAYYRPTGGDVMSVTLVYKDSDEHSGLGTKFTGEHTGDDRFRECLKDIETILGVASPAGEVKA